MTSDVILNFLRATQSQSVHCARALGIVEQCNSIAGDTAFDRLTAVCANVNRVGCRFVFVRSFGCMSSLAMSSMRA